MLKLQIVVQQKRWYGRGLFWYSLEMFERRRAPGSWKKTGGAYYNFAIIFIQSYSLFLSFKRAGSMTAGCLPIPECTTSWLVTLLTRLDTLCAHTETRHTRWESTSKLPSEIRFLTSRWKILIIQWVPFALQLSGFSATLSTILSFLILRKT